MLVSRIFTNCFYRVSTYRTLVKVLLVLLYIVGLLLFFGLFISAGPEHDAPQSSRPPWVNPLDDQMGGRSSALKRRTPAVVDLLPGTDLETVVKKNSTSEERQALRADYEQLSDSSRDTIGRVVRVVRNNFFHPSEKSVNTH